MPTGWEDDAGGPAPTGTALDEFATIYWLLGHPGKHRPAYKQGEVDLLDLSSVAALLGVVPETPDDDPFGPMTGDFAADSARLIRRRLEEAGQAGSSSE